MPAQAQEKFLNPPARPSEQEHTEPVDWPSLESSGLRTVRSKPQLAMLSEDVTETLKQDVVSEAEPPQLGVIRGRKNKSKNETLRRSDGVSVVIECAASLEHACDLFDREADELAILDVEFHLRRIARAVRRLENEMAYALCKKQRQDSLVEGN